MKKNTFNQKLIESIIAKSVEQVKEYLANGANPNAKDNDGHTTLSWALTPRYDGFTNIKPNLEIVKILVEHGADVNEMNELKDGGIAMTPLSKSIYEDSLEIARYLIEKGANVNAKDSQTALHWICNMSYSTAINKNIETYELAKLLIDKGADVNAENEYFKETPLFWATKQSSISYMHNIAELLIENGANVNHKNKNEQTPLMMATSRLNLNAIKLLIENGANVNAKDRFGKTALDYAKKVITDEAERKAQVNSILKNAMQKHNEKKMDKTKQKSKSNNYGMGM